MSLKSPARIEHEASARRRSTRDELFRLGEPHLRIGAVVQMERDENDLPPVDLRLRDKGFPRKRGLEPPGEMGEIDAPHVLCPQRSDRATPSGYFSMKSWQYEKRDP